MRRIGIVPFLLMWAVLMGLQGAVVYGAFQGTADDRPVPLALGVFLILALQALKMLPTAMRLHDQGRPTDNAILTLVPLVNMGLFTRMLRPAPSEKIRNKRLKAWKNRTLAMGALRNGLKAMLQGARVTVPLCLLWGLVSGLVEMFVPVSFNALVSEGNDTQTLLFQAGLALSAFLLLYLVVQLFKIKTAKRNSWLPTLLLLPVALITVALIPRLGTIIDARAPAGLAYMAVGTTWWIFAGAFFYVRWVALGQDLYAHGKVDMKRANALYKGRVWSALVPHGGASVATWVGLQLIIPGLVYALIMAFVVHSVVLDPDKAPFRRSARLTTGHWMRIFNVMALGLVCMMGVYLSALVVAEYFVFLAGASTFVLDSGGYAPGRVIYTGLVAQGMGGALTLPPIAAGIASACSTFVWGCVMAGLVWVYQERVAEMSKKRSKRPADPVSSIAPPDEPVSPPASDGTADTSNPYDPPVQE